MKNFSAHEPVTLSAEADKICQIIESHNDLLRHFKLGSKFQLERMDFRIFRNSRPAIYEIRGLSNWFLKFSNDRKILHEMAGADAIRSMLMNSPGYEHAAAIRISTTKWFTLYTKITGHTLYRALHRGCLFGKGDLSPQAKTTFTNLGKSLASFHSYSQAKELQVSHRGTLALLQRDIHKISRSDEIVKTMTKWISHQEPNDPLTGWIHGHLKNRDIYVNNNRICFLDFETCGIGSPHEDLACLACHAILLQTLPLFPWRRARKAIGIMLKEYQRTRQINYVTLRNHITHNVCRYYVKNIYLRKGKATLAGLPVIKSKLERMLLQLLHSDYDNALSGLELT